MRKTFVPWLLLALTPTVLSAQTIVNDSWADGGRSNGADAQDTDWWTSTSSSAIEVGTGFLGLVSGTSGRGIHGTFAPQTLAIGDKLTATFSFATPATVTTATSGGAQFRIGFFDTTGHNFAQNFTSTTSTEWNNLNGYMMDFDVGPLTSGSANITFRQRTDMTSSALMTSTTPYTQIGAAGGNSYSFSPNTSYVGVFSLTRTGADSLDLSGSLYQGVTLLTDWSVSDVSGIVGSVGALGFQVNSSVFGSSSTIGATDNGIDFSNIQINFTAAPVPEPATASILLGGLILASVAVRRKL
jgi:hypothetical protein